MTINLRHSPQHCSDLLSFEPYANSGITENAMGLRTSKPSGAAGSAQFQAGAIAALILALLSGLYIWADSVKVCTRLL